MKKLMVMAAVMCAAVAAQADPMSYWWTAGTVLKYGETEDTVNNRYSGSASLYFSMNGKEETILATMSMGIILANSYFSNFTIDDAGNEFSCYYVMDDGQGHVFTSETINAFAGGTANMEFGNSGSWATSIPEPTSALLMLLGLAGLALKRKRA